MNTNIAFAHGALDGYNTGENINPYDPGTEPEKNQAYKEGYDYGIFLYTQDESAQ